MIGTVAFWQCTVEMIEAMKFFQLSFVKISNGVEVIELSAFNECSRLREMDISSTVKTIQHSAFVRCTTLEIVKLSTDIEAIGDSVFEE